MDSKPEHRPMAFVIRVQYDRSSLRGQVVAVATGASRLFDDLPGAMAFIEAQVGEREQWPAGADRGTRSPLGG